MKQKLIKFIIVIVALNAIISFAKTFDGKKTTIYNTLTKESRESGYCDLNDVICDGEELPEIEQVKEGKAIITGYNSVPEQTDNTPCISADGTDICSFNGCVIAQNGVEFGTKVLIDGIGVCEVHDRKNSRYDSNWIDIYFGGREKINDALDFGVQERVVAYLK